MSYQLKSASHGRKTAVPPKTKFCNNTQVLPLLFVDRESKEVVVQLSSFLSNLVLLEYKAVLGRFWRITLFLLLVPVG